MNKTMGDTNEIHLGEGASAKQVVAGRDNTLTNIEQQNIFMGARPPDARFSLPTPPRDFTGRKTEIETLVRQLTQGHRAAIAGVAGMGGVGKTALAKVVAVRVAAHFPDGQLWVDLRGTDASPTKPADAMRQVILGLEPIADLSKVDDVALAQIYRGILQGKRALIVLDNAADNVQIRPLLQAEAAFLVTARASLTEAGLRPLRLDVMKKPDARAYLLAQGARLMVGEADVLAELCGYLPLALKIAASHLAARANVKPSTYLAQLREQRLELLRERNDPELNVEAAFGLTYKQLTPDLQLLWRVLGVFLAPFWGSAAQFVWSIEDEGKAEGALGELFRESLIEYDETEEKYRLHDLLREFANRRMTGDERRMAEKRYAEFYKDVARAANDLYLKGGDNVVIGLKLFDQELTHIRAGQKWAAESLEADEDSTRLCSEYPNAAVYLTGLRLSTRERIRWLEDALRAARKLGNKSIEGAALGNLGLAYRALGEVRKAIDYHEQALLIDRELRDRRGEEADVGNLGVAYQILGEVRKAIEYQEQALLIAQEIGDRQGEGTALSGLGLVYADLGELQKAREYYEQALGIAQAIGDRQGEGTALSGLGIAHAGLGELQKTIEYQEQFLAIAKDIEDRRGEGNALTNIGQAYKRLGDMKRAKEFWLEALEIYVAIEDPNAERVRGWLEGE